MFKNTKIVLVYHCHKLLALINYRVVKPHVKYLRTVYSGTQDIFLFLLLVFTYYLFELQMGFY
jgi:hypothetical protein